MQSDILDDEIEELEEDASLNGLKILIVQKLQQMTGTDGWQHLKQNFERRIDSLQDEINIVGGNEMVYTKKDMKIIELAVLKSILNFPSEYVDTVILNNQPIENMDSFKTKFER